LADGKEPMAALFRDQDLTGRDTATSAAANPNRAGVNEIAGSNLVEKIARSGKE
jgi:hypothetical protein